MELVASSSTSTGGSATAARAMASSLPLPLRQVRPVARDHGVIALRQARDEIVGVGKLRRRHHLLVRGVQVPVTDIVLHGAGEQVRIL